MNIHSSSVTNVNFQGLFQETHVERVAAHVIGSASDDIWVDRIPREDVRAGLEISLDSES